LGHDENYAGETNRLRRTGCSSRPGGKLLEIDAAGWEITIMKTLKVDAHRRVIIPGAKPGQVFAFENNGGGRLTLTEVQPVQDSRPAKVRFEKRGRYTVGVTDRPINMDAVKELLADFP
jgi:hypothetical protein